MERLKPGQDVFLRPINNAARRGNNEIVEAKIGTVGKKYFTLEGRAPERFFIDTMLHDAGGYNPNYKAYLSKQTILDENERSALIGQLRKRFDYGCDVPLETLRKISELLNSDTTDSTERRK